ADHLGDGRREVHGARACLAHTGAVRPAEAATVHDVAVADDDYAHPLDGVAQAIVAGGGVHVSPERVTIAAVVLAPDAGVAQPVRSLVRLVIEQTVTLVGEAPVVVKEPVQGPIDPEAPGETVLRPFPDRGVALAAGGAPRLDVHHAEPLRAHVGNILIEGSAAHVAELSPVRLVTAPVPHGGEAHAVASRVRLEIDEPEARVAPLAEQLAVPLGRQRPVDAKADSAAVGDESRGEALADRCVPRRERDRAIAGAPVLDHLRVELCAREMLL